MSGKGDSLFWLRLLYNKEFWADFCSVYWNLHLEKNWLASNPQKNYCFNSLRPNNKFDLQLDSVQLKPRKAQAKRNTTLRDTPLNHESQTVIHLGPISFKEAIYEKLYRWEFHRNDCGEFIVTNWGVFALKFMSWFRTSPTQIFNDDVYNYFEPTSLEFDYYGTFTNNR